jgi:hypothetical protein
MLGEFQAKVVQAIASGSMDSIHKLVLGKHDINKFVFFFSNSSFSQRPT